MTCPEDLRKQLLGLIARLGERAAGEQLRISRNVLARLVGGLTVRDGSLALLREGLALEAPPAQAPPAPASPPSSERKHARKTSGQTAPSVAAKRRSAPARAAR